jgi:hypothetical protein
LPTGNYTVTSTAFQVCSPGTALLLNGASCVQFSFHYCACTAIFCGSRNCAFSGLLAVTGGAAGTTTVGATEFGFLSFGEVPEVDAGAAAAPFALIAGCLLLAADSRSRRAA